MDPVLTAAIVDDEDLSRQIVRELLASHPEVHVVFECANGFDAVKAVAENKPDLLFLDVQMPKLDGFEVLELLDPVPAVVFVTAYDEYAVRAFEVHAVDYLLKPFSQGRFEEALARAVARVVSGRPGPSPGSLSAASRPPGERLTRMAVKDGAKVTVLPLGKVDFFEAQDDYVRIVSGGKGWLKAQTLASLEQQLDPSRFVRVHRSYLVNLDRLVRLESAGKGSSTAVLADGTELPVSRAGAGRLKTLLEGPRKGESR